MLGIYVRLLPSNLKRDVVIDRSRFKVTYRVMCEVGVAIVTVIASHDGGGAKAPSAGSSLFISVSGSFQKNWMVVLLAPVEPGSAGNLEQSRV